MKNILLLDFEDREDAKWVLEVGRISFKGSMLQLDWWNQGQGCLKRKDMVKRDLYSCFGPSPPSLVCRNSKENRRCILWFCHFG